MSPLSDEIRTWLAARNSGERQAILETLALDVVERESRPHPVYGSGDQPVAFVVPNTPPLPKHLQDWLDQPGVLDRLRRQGEAPERRGIDADEFTDRVWG